MQTAAYLDAAGRDRDALGVIDRLGCLTMIFHPTHGVIVGSRAVTVASLERLVREGALERGNWCEDGGVKSAFVRAGKPFPNWVAEKIAAERIARCKQ